MVKCNYSLALNESGKGVLDSSKTSSDFQMSALLAVLASPAKLHSKIHYFISDGLFYGGKPGPFPKIIAAVLQDYTLYNWK